MISVCLASYDGEKYISQQLDSILQQLDPSDELIVSDDGSSDITPKILAQYAKKDSRIRTLTGPGKGVIKNFEHALSHANGDIIILSDQDDIWVPNKVSRIKEVFNHCGNHCMLVLHDAQIVNSSGSSLGQTLFEFRSSKAGLLNCLWKNPYVGCCMAFRKDLLREVLPFPDGIEMHDWWIALNAECGKRTVLIPDRLIYYRRHDGNVSNMHHHPLGKMIHNRIYFIKFLALRRFQLKYEQH